MNTFKKTIIFFALLGIMPVYAMKKQTKYLPDRLMSVINGFIIKTEKNIATLIHPEFGTTIKLDPETKKQLPRLEQLIATYQPDSTKCGYWASVNALAIEQLFTQNKLLHNTSINKKALEMFNNSKIDTKEIDPWEISHFLEQKNSNFYNYYTVGLIGKTTMLVDTRKPLDNIPTDLVTVKSLDYGSIHFICNNGGHWVLLSFIKRKNELPFMLYLDSKNGPLTEKNSIYPCIEYLYKECFKVFPALNSSFTENKNLHEQKDLIMAQQLQEEFSKDFVQKLKQEKIDLELARKLEEELCIQDSLKINQEQKKAKKRNNTKKISPIGLGVITEIVQQQKINKQKQLEKIDQELAQQLQKELYQPEQEKQQEIMSQKVAQRLQEEQDRKFAQEIKKQEDNDAKFARQLQQSLNTPLNQFEQNIN